MSEQTKPVIRHEMWAVVFPDGHIVTGADMLAECDAWRVALGWPHESDIEDAKKRGVFATKAILTYRKP